MQEVKGVTYSVEHYNQFNETGDKNYFEEIIDAMILDGISGMNDTFRSAIRGLSRDKKRMTILSLLDKDLNLFKRIKALTDKNIGKMDHIKDIILMLREYVKVGEVEKKKFGEVMTPLELVKEMLATLPEEVWSNPNLKWLDPANGTGPYPIMVIYKLMKGLENWEPDVEKRYKHIVENMIYVCELQPKNMFLYMCAVDPFDTYKLNIYTGSFLEGAFDKHMKDVWGVEKFDVVMGNPPYQSYTHMKFINKSINKLIDNGFLCFVHPSQQFLDIKQKTTTKDEELLISNVQKFNTVLYLINGNLLFDVEMFFTPLSITFLQKKLRNSEFLVIDRQKDIIYNYPSIKEVNLLGWSNEYQNLKNKILNFVNKNGHIKSLSKREGDFYVGISEIRGHACKKNMFKSDFYTILPIESSILNEKKSKHFNAGFDKYEEAECFQAYLKTKFARFCLSLFKINSTLAGTSSVLTSIPIVDFNTYHSDESLRNLFDIDDKEWDFVNSIIKKFYPED